MFARVEAILISSEFNICSFLCLDTGEGSQCSNSQSCSAHPHLADQGFPLDGRGLPCYDTESMSVYHIIVGEVFGVSVKFNRKIEAKRTNVHSFNIYFKRFIWIRKTIQLNLYVYNYFKPKILGQIF
jgi:hypothetical protein